MSPPAARRIGPYTLEKKLGRGGMAEVFVAIHRGAAGFERPVCVKRLLPDIAWDAEFQRLFVREVTIAGQLIHSNIVQVFDCIEEGRNLGLVMELVEGIDLASLVRRLRSTSRSMPHGLVAYIAGQILLGLAFAHDRRIVHRDISPQNILLSRHGEVKITDFGLAKVMTTLATLNNATLGKFAYMSPEQATGAAADHRTDLYSTGLVLYELVTGSPFFRVKNQAEAFRAVAHASQPRLPDVQPALAALVERLLCPDRNDRFQTARAALTALPPWEVCGPLGAREVREMLRLVLEPASDTTVGLPKVGTV